MDYSYGTVCNCIGVNSGGMSGYVVISHMSMDNQCELCGDAWRGDTCISDGWLAMKGSHLLWWLLIVDYP